MNTVAVVVNPTKLDKPDAVREDLASVAARHGCELAWYPTDEDDPGTGQARQALHEGAAMVCALGGDGTVRAVATALAGGDVPLVLLPGGTGNLLARNLHTPVDSLTNALDAALGGTTRRIDVGRVAVDGGDEQVFLVMSGIGLDAETMADTSEETKARMGWMAYGITGLRKLSGKGFAVAVGCDGTESSHRRARSVLVGNCGSVQGDFELFPQARVDDGELDVLVFAPRGLLSWVQALQRLVAQRRKNGGPLSQRAGREIEVNVRNPVQAQIDGDPLGMASRLVFRVEAGALPVRVTGDGDVI